MKDLLFLCHRIPYPPDKGENIHSYNILRGLSERYRVHLGCFVDSSDDAHHIDALQDLCEETYCASQKWPQVAWSTVSAMACRDPLSVAMHRHAGLAAWVEHILAERQPCGVYAVSSAMAQFVGHRPQIDTRLIMDFVDVDSEKWRLRAERSPWPMSWLYRREATKLAIFDRATADRFDTCLFVSEAEAERFQRLSPNAAGKVRCLPNGVDIEFFSPDLEFPNPYDAKPVVVFTGTMNYWPNVEAVVWFAREVLPVLHRWEPSLKFAVVGRSPSARVRHLQSDAVMVTGAVPDVRPYIAHAAAVVVPLQASPGVANKVLEGMAMAKPVIATPQAVDGLSLVPGRDYLHAFGPEDFAGAVRSALQADGEAKALGAAARRHVVQSFAWQATIDRLPAIIEGEAIADEIKSAQDRHVGHHHG